MLGELANIVRDLGRQMLTWRGTAAADGNWYGAQLKIDADVRAHGILVERLRSLAPDIPVVSEEDADSHSPIRLRRYWLIDPIDGTASFSAGYPGFVTQVALMEDHRPVLAAVDAPALDLLYLAERGAGATLNGTSLLLDGRLRGKTLIDNSPEPQGTAKEAYVALGLTNYVECGSISLKICRVADGTADLFFKDVIVRDWDIAAPNLVIEEAGGRLTNIDGTLVIYRGSFEKPGIVVAAFPEIADELITWLNARGDRRPSENQLEDRQA